MSILKGIFFTSIPKAGKNLVYSFLGQLGYTRPAVAREAAVWWTEEPWLRRAGRTCTYALPPVPMTGASARSAERACFVERALALRAKEVLHHHLAYSDELANELARFQVPVVFVYRDPRDILLSMADYILVQQKPAHLAVRFSGLGRTSLIERLWTGDETLIGFADYLDSFAGWRRLPGVAAVRFEDLVGEAGLGSRAAQETALRSILNLAGQVSNDALARAQAKTFNPKAGTFYKGQAGRWRDESDPRVILQLSSTAMTELAQRWGYPAN